MVGKNLAAAGVGRREILDVPRQSIGDQMLMVEWFASYLPLDDK